MIKYIIMGICADNMNVTNTPFGSISPFSQSSFLKRFELDVNSLAEDIYDDDLDDFKFQVNSFAIIEHDFMINDTFYMYNYYEDWNNKDKSFKNKKVAVKNTIASSAIVSELTANGNFTLILKVDIEGYDKNALYYAILLILHRLKFVGGNVRSVYLDKFNFIKSEEAEVKEYLKNLKRYGYFYKLDDKHLKTYMESASSVGEAIIWSCQPITKNTTNHYLVNKPGFRFPTIVGYQLLETPKIRRGVRNNNNKHAFAEPVYSIVDRKPMGKFINSSKSLEDLGFMWQKHFDNETQTFYVQS